MIDEARSSENDSVFVKGADVISIESTFRFPRRVRGEARSEIAAVSALMLAELMRIKCPSRVSTFLSSRASKRIYPGLQ